jgi:hypothetical protein
MAIPYEVLEPTFIAVVLGLAVLFVIAPALRLGPDTERRTRTIRLVTGTVLAIVIVGSLGLRALGAPIDPTSQPLHFGHSWSDGGPRLLAEMDLHPASGQGFPAVELLYAYAPGAEIRAGITLANDGDVPLTVTGFDSPANPNVRSVELRLPPQLSHNLPPPYPNEGTDDWSSEPFHPFEIPAHDEAGLAVEVTLGVCPGMTPVATLAPSASLIPASDPSLTGGFTALSDINVRYTALGISRTANIVLGGTIYIITSERNVYGCPPA